MKKRIIKVLGGHDIRTVAAVNAIPVTTKSRYNDLMEVDGLSKTPAEDLVGLHFFVESDIDRSNGGRREASSIWLCVGELDGEYQRKHLVKVKDFHLNELTPSSHNPNYDTGFSIDKVADFFAE